jgi:hypothetical protein
MTPGRSVAPHGPYIAELLRRPMGRPSRKPFIEYKGFLYQAASWKTARRVVAKVEHHVGTYGSQR